MGFSPTIHFGCPSEIPRSLTLELEKFFKSTRKLQDALRTQTGLKAYCR